MERCREAGAAAPDPCLWRPEVGGHSTAAAPPPYGAVLVLAEEATAAASASAFED